MEASFEKKGHTFKQNPKSTQTMRRRYNNNMSPHSVQQLQQHFKQQHETIRNGYVQMSNPPQPRRVRSVAPTSRRVRGLPLLSTSQPTVSVPSSSSSSSSSPIENWESFPSFESLSPAGLASSDLTVEMPYSVPLSNLFMSLDDELGGESGDEDDDGLGEDEIMERFYLNFTQWQLQQQQQQQQHGDSRVPPHLPHGHELIRGIPVPIAEPHEPKLEINVTETDSAKKICIICSEREVCTMFLECLHSMACVTCSRALLTNAPLDRAPTCPVCRGQIERIVKLLQV